MISHSFSEKSYTFPTLFLDFSQKCQYWCISMSFEASCLALIHLNTNAHILRFLLSLTTINAQLWYSRYYCSITYRKASSRLEHGSSGISILPVPNIPWIFFFSSTSSSLKEYKYSFSFTSIFLIESKKRDCSTDNLNDYLSLLRLNQNAYKRI